MSTIRGERDKIGHKLLNGANKLTVVKAERLIAQFNKLSAKLNEPTFAAFVAAFRKQMEEQKNASSKA